MSQLTHTVRPHHIDKAKAEHVTDTQLKQMQEQFGERHFKASYVVEKIAEKPAPLATKDEPKKKELPAS